MWSSGTGAASAVIILLFALVANGETSLWIPDTDPQPISAGILGVGNDGRTTWQIQQGTPTGTATDPADFGFPGTATLVEGPSDAILSAAFTTQGLGVALAMSCTINNGVAMCVNTLSEGSSSSVVTLAETVSPILVQGGGPIGTGSVPVSAPAVTGSPAQTAGSQVSAGLSPTSSGPKPTGSTGGNNGAGLHHITGYLVGLAGLISTAVINFVL